jgi:ribosome-binding ATPase YchF (GTP1/OBG family)
MFKVNAGNRGRRGCRTVVVCAQIEAEIAEFEEDEKKCFYKT